MKCVDVQPDLSAFADGELTGPRAAGIALHVQSCADCQVRIERQRMFRAALRRAINAEPVPAGLRDRIRAGLSQQSRRSAGRILRLGHYVAAAAALLFAVLVWSEQPLADGVSAQQFAGVHKSCAVRVHDQFNVARLAPGAACERLREVMTARGRGRPGPLARVCTPRLDDAYRAAGACYCFPSNFIRVLHVSYLDPNQPHLPLSVFSLERTAALRFGRPMAVAASGARMYVAAQSGTVAVISWEERRQSYALCGPLPADELARIADRLDVAALFRGANVLALNLDVGGARWCDGAHHGEVALP